MLKYLRLTLLLIAALGLGSCDSALHDDAPERFTIAPLAPGTSLFPSSAKSGTSPAYGCYVSSPNPGAPDDERYRYGAFMLSFPESVTQQAAGRYRVVALNVGSTTLYAAEPRNEPVLVRQVRCVIPDVEEAEALLGKEIVRFDAGEDATWEGEAMPTGMSTGASAPNAQASLGKSAGTTCEIFVIQPVPGVCRPVPTGMQDSDDCAPATPGYTVVICDHGGGDPPSWGPGDEYDPPGRGTPSGPGGDVCDSDQLMPEADQEGLGCNTPALTEADLIDLLSAIIEAIKNGERFDDPALWRRLLGAYSPEAAQCVDAVSSSKLDGQQITAILNCASNYYLGLDGTDLVRLLDTIPGGLEWAARSSAGGDLYGWLVQAARDNPAALRTIALQASGLSDLHALGQLRNQSSGIVNDFRITSLSGFEALYQFSNTGVREITTSPGQRKWMGTWDGPYGKITGVLYFADTGFWTIQFSPCPAFLPGVTCGDKWKYVIRFDSLD